MHQISPDPIELLLDLTDQGFIAFLVTETLALQQQAFSTTLLQLLPTTVEQVPGSRVSDRSGMNRKAVGHQSASLKNSSRVLNFSSTSSNASR